MKFNRRTVIIVALVLALLCLARAESAEIKPEMKLSDKQQVAARPKLPSAELAIRNSAMVKRNTKYLEILKRQVKLNQKNIQGMNTPDSKAPIAKGNKLAAKPKESIPPVEISKENFIENVEKYRKMCTGVQGKIALPDGTYVDCRRVEQYQEHLDSKIPPSSSSGGEISKENFIENVEKYKEMCTGVQGKIALPDGTYVDCRRVEQYQKHLDSKINMEAVSELEKEQPELAYQIRVADNEVRAGDMEQYDENDE